MKRTIRQAIERSGHDRGPVLIYVPLRGEPRYADLRALAEALHAAVGDHRPLLAALSPNVALSLGRILARELPRSSDIIVIDGLELADLDYLDIGALVLPTVVIPVLVKTVVPQAR